MVVYGKYQTGWRRLFAGIIDGFILWAISWPVYLALGMSTNDYLFWVSDSIDIIYVVSLTYLLGGTIGKRILGLQVLDARTEERIGLSQSVLRHIGMVVVFIVEIGIVILVPHQRESILSGELIEKVEIWAALWFLLELITMLFNEKRRALHDFIAGTVVVNIKDKRMELSLNQDKQSGSA